MFDKNYMNHNLVEFEQLKWNGKSYRCTKCNSHIIYYQDSDYPKYRIKKRAFDKNGYFNSILDYKDNDLTCDEMIIKNRIE